MPSALPGFAVLCTCLAPGIGTGVEGRRGTVVKLPDFPGCPTAVGARLDRFDALTGDDDCRTLRGGPHREMAVAEKARGRLPGEPTERLGPGPGSLPGSPEWLGSGRSGSGAGRPGFPICAEPFRRTA